MSKKLMLLALAAVSAALFAMPALASAAQEPLHLNPTPSGSQAIDNVTVGTPTLSTSGGTKVECSSFSGSATFEAGGTTGHINMTFSGDCHSNLGTTCNSGTNTNGTIVTPELPFHLLTLPNNKPGVLVTPVVVNGVSTFAEFTCQTLLGPVTITVEGNGLVGTITEPACGATSNMATIDFNATGNGVQEHTTVAGDATVYRLKKGTENAAQDATGTLTLTSQSKLECT